MLTLIFPHAHIHTYWTSHFFFFLLWLLIFRQHFSPFRFLVCFSPNVLTYSQPTREVSHDTQDADTKISYLIYLGSVYVCQSPFISLPSTHLYTLRSPCWAHRWYWHMAATFAFLQIWLFCCNVYSYSPPISTQLCVNVTLPQSFLLGAANLEFVQLRCQWSITQIQHNNKS